jgi:hypothetical protein
MRPCYIDIYFLLIFHLPSPSRLATETFETMVDDGHFAAVVSSIEPLIPGDYDDGQRAAPGSDGMGHGSGCSP